VVAAPEDVETAWRSSNHWRTLSEG
jgi:hypothetical protein